MDRGGGPSRARSRIGRGRALGTRVNSLGGVRVTELRASRGGVSGVGGVAPHVGAGQACPARGEAGSSCGPAREPWRVSKVSLHPDAGKWLQAPARSFCGEGFPTLSPSSPQSGRGPCRALRFLPRFGALDPGGAFSRPQGLRAWSGPQPGSEFHILHVRSCSANPAPSPHFEDPLSTACLAYHVGRLGCGRVWTANPSPPWLDSASLSLLGVFEWGR